MSMFNDTLRYLFSLEKFGIVFGLENIRWILDLLGNPQKELKCIHIAGTNGKGSVASMLSHIIKDSGYRVGKYTSPHLVSFTERITIDEKEITEEEVVELTAFIRKRIEQKDNKRFFTFFDFTTSIAFEYFFREKIDIALIEVGMGGRLDSTNIISPVACVITNISLDHTEQLGNNIIDIAYEKAGIMKDGVPVITGADRDALTVIERVANIKKSPLFSIGKDFWINKKADGVMDYNGLKRQLKDIKVNLAGDHQLVNAAIALCVSEVISELGFALEETSIRKGLSGVTWYGRLEIVKENPVVILDGAHNCEGMHTLTQYFTSHYTEKRKILIFGVMKDKAYKEMLEEILHLIDTVIFTKPNTERALPLEALNAFIYSYNLRDSTKNSDPIAEPINHTNVFYTQDVKAALEKAKAIADNNDLILITGSLYTIGEARQIIDEIF